MVPAAVPANDLVYGYIVFNASSIKTLDVLGAGEGAAADAAVLPQDPAIVSVRCAPCNFLPAAPVPNSDARVQTTAAPAVVVPVATPAEPPAAVAPAVGAVVPVVPVARVAPVAAVAAPVAKPSTAVPPAEEEAYVPDANFNFAEAAGAWDKGDGRGERAVEGVAAAYYDSGKSFFDNLSSSRDVRRDDW